MKQKEKENHLIEVDNLNIYVICTLWYTPSQKSMNSLSETLFFEEN